MDKIMLRHAEIDIVKIMLSLLVSKQTYLNLLSLAALCIIFAAPNAFATPAQPVPPSPQLEARSDWLTIDLPAAIVSSRRLDGDNRLKVGYDADPARAGVQIRVRVYYRANSPRYGVQVWSHGEEETHGRPSLMGMTKTNPQYTNEPLGAYVINGKLYIEGRQTYSHPNKGYDSQFTWTTSSGVLGNLVSVAQDNPPVVAFTSIPPQLTQSTTASFAWQITNQVSPQQVTCSYDSAAFSTCASPVMLGGVTVGSHTYSVRVQNPNGTNTQTHSWTVEQALPAVLINSLSSHAAERVQFVGSGFLNVDKITLTTATGTVTYYRPGTSGAIFNGTAQITWTDSGITIRSVTLAGVTVTGAGMYDSQNNLLKSITPSPFVVEVFVPANVTITQSPSANTNANIIQVSYAAQGSGAVVTCSLDLVALSACNSPLQLMNVAEGVHSVSISATDIDGGVNTKVAVFSVDRTAPVIEADDIQLFTSPSVGGTAVTVQASAQDTVDGDVTVACNPAAGTILTISEYSYTCSANDVAGNIAVKEGIIRVGYAPDGGSSIALPANENDPLYLPTPYQDTGVDPVNVSNPAPLTPGTHANQAVYANSNGYTISYTSYLGFLKEEILVTQRQGAKTWAWELMPGVGGQAPQKQADGTVEYGREGKMTVLAPVVLSTDGDNITPSGLSWTVTGNVISLTLNDASLPLPYIIDPTLIYPQILYPTEYCQNAAQAICSGEGLESWRTLIQGSSNFTTTGATAPSAGDYGVRTGSVGNFAAHTLSNDNLPLGVTGKYGMISQDLAGTILPNQNWTLYMAARGTVTQTMTSQLQARMWKVTKDGSGNIASAVPLSGVITGPTVTGVSTAFRQYGPLVFDPADSLGTRTFASNEELLVMFNIKILTKVQAASNTITLRVNTNSTINSGMSYLDFGTPPPPPILNLDADPASPVTAEKDIDFTWTNSGGAAEQTECRVDVGAWQNCATANSEALSNVDTGDHKFEVRALNANPISGQDAASGYASHEWEVLDPAPVNTGAPSVNGSAEVGSLLALDPGTWTNSPTLTYQWKRCDSVGGNCAAVNGATSLTYITTVADLGATMRVDVTATTVGGSATATTAATGVMDDTLVDSADLVLTKGSTPSAQHIVGNRVYYNPSNPGSFNARVNAQDAGTGVRDVNSPDLNTTAPAPGGFNVDPTYGNGGVAYGILDSTNSQIVAVIDSGSGGLLSAGYMYDENALAPWGMGSYGVALVRSLPNGQIDASFGTSGRATYFQPGAYFVAQSVAVASDGKILVSGYHSDSNSGNAVGFVMRFNSDGSVDAAYGAGGVASIPAPASAHPYADQLVVDASGKATAIARGYDYATNNPILRSARFDAAGNLDTSYGVGGINQIDTSAQALGGSGDININTNHGGLAKAQPDGKIILPGSVSNYMTGSEQAVVIRLNANGDLDSSFDGDGIKQLTRGSIGYGVDVQFDGKILVTTQDYYSNTSILVWRLSADGSEDTSFGSNGLSETSTPLGFSQAHSRAVKVSGSGILVAYYAYDSSQNTSKYQAALLDTSGALVELAPGVLVGDPSNDDPQGVLIQSTGRIIVFGRIYKYSQGSGWGSAGYTLSDGSPYWTPAQATVDTASPYDVEYAWIGGAPAPGSQTVVVTDNNGNTKSLSLEVVADATLPSVDLSTSLNNQDVVSGNLNLDGTASDTGSGLAAVSLITPSGTLTCAVTAGSVNCPVIDTTSLNDGLNVFTLQGTDHVGNAASNQLALIVDNNAPVLSVTVVNNGDGRLRITATANDTASGLNSGVVTFSGPTSGTVCATSTSPEVCYINLANLQTGTYTITYNAVDRAGNVAAPTTGTIDVDPIAPVAVIDAAPASPFAGAVVLTGSATDNIAVISSTLSWSGPQSGNTNLTLDGAGDWQHALDTVVMLNGSYMFALTVTDTAGNTTIVTRDVDVTNPMPSVTITAPAPAQEFDNAVGLVGTFITSDAPATSVVCEVRLNSTGGTLVLQNNNCTSPFNMSSLTLTNQPYYLIVRATNLAGTDTESVMFKVGKTPALAIDSGPAEGSTIYSNGAAFTWSAPGATSYTCRLDNFTAVACASGWNTHSARYATTTATLGAHLGSGPHSVTITASNSIGATSLTRTFTVGEQPLVTSNPDTGLHFAQYERYASLLTSGASGFYPATSRTFSMREVVKENSDGSVLVLGSEEVHIRTASSTQTTSYNLVIMKVTAEQKLDTSYGTNGVLRVAVGSQLPDYKASGDYVYTTSTGPNDDTRVLRRYALDGIADSVFGNVNVTLPSNITASNAIRNLTTIEEDNDGNIMVALTAANNSNFNNYFAILVKVSNTGGGVYAQDSSFGNEGTTRLDAVKSPFCSSSPSFFRMSISDIVQKSDGSYIVGGGEWDGGCGRAFGIYRVLVSGSQDTSFGTGGVASGGSGSHSVKTLKLLAGEKIEATANTLSSVLIARFNANGTADNTYNTSGSTGSQNQKEPWDSNVCVVARSIANAPDGGYYMLAADCGYSGRTLSGKPAVVKTTISGAADASYSPQGIAILTENIAGSSLASPKAARLLSTIALAHGEPTLLGTQGFSGGANQGLFLRMALPGVDRILPPSVTVTSAPQQNESIGQYLHVEYTVGGADANVTVACSLEGENVGNVAISDCTSPLTVTGLVDDDYVLTIEAQGSLGQGDTTVTRAFTVDQTSTAPTIVFTGGIADGAEMIHPSLRYQFAATGQYEILCRVNSSPFRACISNHSFSGFVDGVNTIAIRAIGQGGVADATRTVDIEVQEGVFAFIQKSAFDQAFYKMNSLGGNVERIDLANMATDNIGSSLSPDGSRIAFQRLLSGNRVLWVYNVAAGTMATTNISGMIQNGTPKWLPDSSGFITSTGGGLIKWTASTNSLLFVLSSIEQFPHYTVSADANWMLAKTRPSSSLVWDVRLVNLTTGSATVLYSTSSSLQNSRSVFAFIPDSSAFIWNKCDAVACQMYLRNVSGSGDGTITNMPSAISTESMSSLQFVDSDSVIYMRGGTNPGIFRFDLGSGSEVRLATGGTASAPDPAPGPIFSMVLSPDLTKLAFGQGQGNINSQSGIYVVPVQGTEADAIKVSTNTSGTNQSPGTPNWSADSSLIAFVVGSGSSGLNPRSISVVRASGVDSGLGKAAMIVPSNPYTDPTVYWVN